MPNVECLVKSRMLTAPTALTLRHKEGEVNRLARRLRASLGPRLRFQLRRGLAGAFGVGGRRRFAFLTCAWGSTPTRTRSAASRLARAPPSLSASARSRRRLRRRRTRALVPCPLSLFPFYLSSVFGARLLPGCTLLFT